MSEIGHNVIAKDQLRAIVERIETIESAIREHNDDKKDIYAEAKGNGYDVPTVRAIIKLRKEDSNKRSERETILETYMHALGMLA